MINVKFKYSSFMGQGGIVGSELLSNIFNIAWYSPTLSPYVPNPPLFLSFLSGP